MLTLTLIGIAQIKTDPVTYDGSAADTVRQSATAYSDVIVVKGQYPSTYDLQVYIQEVSGASNITVTPQWSNGVKWSNISSVVYKGTGSDTTIAFTTQVWKGDRLRVKYVTNATAQKNKFTEYFKNWYSITPK